MRKVLSFFALFLLITILAACSSDSASSDTSESDDSSSDESSKEEEGWVPTSDVEFVVPYAPGGGSDTNARTVVRVMEENGLADVNFNVVNKDGGSALVGMAYQATKAGDPHNISTVISGQISSALLSDSEVRVSDLTPLATLAIDSFALVVAEDSEYETVEDFIEAAKEKELTIAGTGKGSNDHLVMVMMNNEIGTSLEYVTFQSGGETTSAVLGGHVDGVITNPNEVMSQVEAGEMRVLATASEEQLAAPFDAPTFVELGYPEVVLTQFRGYVGPPDMPAEAVAYYEDLLQKVFETDMWQEEYIEKFSLVGEYKNAEESKEFYQEITEQTETLLDEIGMLE